MKSQLSIFLVIILLCSLFIVGNIHFADSSITPLSSGTQVGGILWDNTTWTAANSPYIITSTVQVPSNATLIIEAGVSVTTSMSYGNFLFLLNGKIIAHGAPNNRISFDAGGGSTFFLAQGSTADSFLDSTYCVFKNGRVLWDPVTGPGGWGHFNLTHSEITNLSSISYLWYPKKDIYIEYNTFTNSAGFSTWNDASPSNIYIY